MRKNINVLLLILIHIFTPSSAQNTTAVSTNTTTEILTRPVDASVFVGTPPCLPALCPKHLLLSPSTCSVVMAVTASPALVDMWKISPGSLWKLSYKKGQSVAVWTFKGTSKSDNNTRVVCQLPNGFDSSTATLRIYDNGSNTAILIGCVIGGFFGIILVFALSYTLLQRSEAFQKCFRPKEDEDDTFSIISKGFAKQKN